MKKFYVVATPIGNLEDITLRAIRTLKEVDLVLCEDTRVTKKLLDRYEIKTPTMSYHSQSKLSKIDKILDLIEDGKTLALVSDAGTPCISDPGSLLVSKIKEKFGDDIQIIPIPGPSAVITALSASGVPASDFYFSDFYHTKKAGRHYLKKFSNQKEQLYFMNRLIVF